MASRQDRKPLLAYLRVEEDFEAKLLITLERTARETRKEIRALSGKRGIGARVRQDQLRLVLKATLERQAELWRIVGSTVQAGRVDAMAAAVKTNFAYEDVLLRSALSPRERRLLLESATEQAKKGIDAVIAKLNGLSDYELSAQVYKTQALSNGLVRRKVIDVLSRGGSWKEMADEVSGLINPRTPGGVSYAAKRLGRTEINNAYHAAAVVEGRQSPFIIGQKWNLSGSHPRPDQCNDFAEKTHQQGSDVGVYRPGDVPGKPHPQCLCFLTPVTPSREEFLANFLGGRYDSYLGRA
jgi:hypothetical protein